MFYTIITYPAASTIISDLGDYGGPFFTEFYNIIKTPLGIVFAVTAIMLLVWGIMSFANIVKNHR